MFFSSVKCFVVKSVKQDQIITKGKKKIETSSNEMLKNMQHLENFCIVTLDSEVNERTRAHNVVLASVIFPSDTCSRLMTRTHFMN